MNSPADTEGYPREMETWSTTKTGIRIFLRPIKAGDGPRFKRFLLSLSDQSVYLKFFRLIRPTDDFVERLVNVDYVHQLTILALAGQKDDAQVLGMARYDLNKEEGTAEAAFAVRDDYQNQGIGRQLVAHLTTLGRSRGLNAFTAQVMVDNRRMMHLFRALEGKEYTVQVKMEAGIFYLNLAFM
ncbi:MAG: GNAT family N-acetyltransferase [Deltaproteobacteria bacterium]|nr:GNAT family N-acetyltransferase [Deltaproteobacteria bacterium]